MPISPESKKTRDIAPEIAAARSRVAAATRWNGDVTAAKRELKAEVLADYIRKIVDSAPELSSDQLDRLAALLRPAAKGGGADAA